MQLVEMFLQKVFATRKCNVGMAKMTIAECTYKKQKNIWIQFMAIYNSYLDLFNCQYHSHLEDIHILVVTSNDLLTNLQFGEMFFYKSNFCNN